MKMAKASEQEMNMANKLAAMLENVDSGYYPMPIDGSDCENEPSLFDPDDNDHLRVFYDRVMALINSAPGGIFRVVGGFDTLMHNDIVDPSKDVLELHPRLVRGLVLTHYPEAYEHSWADCWMIYKSKYEPGVRLGRGKTAADAWSNTLESIKT